MKKFDNLSGLYKYPHIYKFIKKPVADIPKQGWLEIRKNKIFTTMRISQGNDKIKKVTQGQDVKSITI